MYLYSYHISIYFILIHIKSLYNLYIYKLIISLCILYILTVLYLELKHRDINRQWRLCLALWSIQVQRTIFRLTKKQKKRQKNTEKKSEQRKSNSSSQIGTTKNVWMNRDAGVGNNRSRAGAEPGQGRARPGRCGGGARAVDCDASSDAGSTWRSLFQFLTFFLCSTLAPSCSLSVCASVCMCVCVPTYVSLCGGDFFKCCC